MEWLATVRRNQSLKGLFVGGVQSLGHGTPHPFALCYNRGNGVFGEVYSPS